MKYENILKLVGGTPLIKMSKITDKEVNLWGKLEACNPMGSVKDRIALAMIEAAERSGELRPGQMVIEATSGNTGIGLAMVCARKGYPLVVTMPENFSIERRKLLRFLGAKVVLTPAAEKGSGMLQKAEELARKHGYFLPRQFQNQANAQVHYDTTAQEIISDFLDEPLYAVVTGFGTGGTLLGIARAVRDYTPKTRVIVAEPDNSPVLASGIPQARDPDGSASESHPHFRPHLMQGWAPDFISALTQQAVDEQLIDEIVAVNGNDSIALTRELACKEGIFVGTSAGATLAAAVKLADHAPRGANIVVMLPDTGERYLSTPLFDAIDQNMNEEELRLSRSTPSCRFDDAATNVAQLPVNKKDETAASYFEQVLKPDSVVMFSLEWCEFCWTLRRYFDAAGILFKSVDLDSVEMQKNDLGVALRAELRRRLGVGTIPQVFVGEQHIGGCSDVIEAYENGRMQRLLSECGVIDTPLKDVSPADFLPAWVQSH
ncbi:MAG: pyridoxal-phosphate dependent enzyme [Pseudomonadota bacterium]